MEINLPFAGCILLFNNIPGRDFLSKSKIFKLKEAVFKKSGKMSLVVPSPESMWFYITIIFNQPVLCC